jgi:hypothetical protein
MTAFPKAWMPACVGNDSISQSLDARVRGHDGISQSLDARVRGNDSIPQSLDVRLRGHDGISGAPARSFVGPADGPP